MSTRAPELLVVRMSTESSDDPLTFDEKFASALVGKYVLIGLTVHDARGDLSRREQFHGIVVSADCKAGIAVALRGAREGETKWLPPATDVFEAARPGTYALSTTGEKVVDPDFTAMWLVNQTDG
jgi:hypothetical protein